MQGSRTMKIQCSHKGVFESLVLNFDPERAIIDTRGCVLARLVIGTIQTKIGDILTDIADIRRALLNNRGQDCVVIFMIRHGVIEFKELKIISVYDD